HRQRVFAEKRRTPSEQIEQDRSETVNVRRWSKVGRGSFGLLRCDVTGRAENGERAREIGIRIEPLCQSEIGHERFATTIEQNVSRLQIAMQNALLMRVLHGARHPGY